MNGAVFELRKTRSYSDLRQKIFKRDLYSRENEPVLWSDHRPLVKKLLADHMYQISAPIVRPVAPLLTEAGTSSEEDVPSPILVATDDHLLYIGSSNDNAKSTLHSPQSEHEGKLRKISSESSFTTNSQNASHFSTPRSDRHHVKGSAMTCLGGRVSADGEPPPLIVPSSTTTLASVSSEPVLNQNILSTPGSSKARQKKFHRHFKQVNIEERVLNYYSCALVADILLQGHLYITKNYFAFYSNVFGYVTKVLIPTVDVLKVSKEKTAKIIPNAIGVCTEDEKHVFGSLLSRDSTYKLMVEVWKAACPNPVLEITVPQIKNVEDSASGEALLEETSGSAEESPIRVKNRSPSGSLSAASAEPYQHKVVPKMRPVRSIVPRHGGSTSFWRTSSTLLIISTTLLVSLFFSAGYLLYRISVIQESFSDFPLPTNSEDVFEEILKWQSTLHSRSSNEVHEFVNTNLQQIAKVRHSLEALSILIFGNSEYSRARNSDSSQSSEPMS